MTVPSVFSTPLSQSSQPLPSTSSSSSVPTTPRLHNSTLISLPPKARSPSLPSSTVSIPQPKKSRARSGSKLSIETTNIPFGGERKRSATVIDVDAPERARVGSGIELRISRASEDEERGILLENDLVVHSHPPPQRSHGRNESTSGGSIRSNRSVGSLTTRSHSEVPNAEDEASADGATTGNDKWYQLSSKPRPVLLALFKAALLFIFSLVFLVLLLKALLPPIDPVDAPKVKIPKSFDDLKALNEVLQVYKQTNSWRVLGSFITVYLFLQAFSLPGSMYMSILGGAMWGVAVALPLCCFCVATGALLCYLISAFLGPVLLSHSSKWRHRVDRWKKRIQNQGGNVVSYLIVLRIAPLPPHWVVNMVCPHLGIGIGTFWMSTFLGIMGVTFIHTQIGTTLDQMTSPGDFHLISWRNFFGLAGVVVAVMIPVAMRYAWRSELQEAASEDIEPTEEATNEGVTDGEEETLTQPGISKSSKAKNKLVYVEEEEDDVEDDRLSFIGNASIRSVDSFSTYASAGASSYNSDAGEYSGAEEEEPFIHKSMSKSKAKSYGKSARKHEKQKSIKDILVTFGVGEGTKPGSGKKKANREGGTESMLLLKKEEMEKERRGDDRVETGVV